MTFRAKLSPSLKKIPLGITPLFLAMGFAVTGASYFAYHSLTGPEIGLTKKQRQPNFIGQKYNYPTEKSTKLYNVNPILK